MRLFHAGVRAITLIPTAAGFAFFSESAGIERLAGTSFGIPGADRTFDYVVVGGGTAGLTVALRLAKNSNLSVAVVEAGSFYELTNGNYSQIPALAPTFATDAPTDIQPGVDWGIVTVPESTLNYREIHYTQGRCLGGSSGRNYLLYQRPTNDSLQRWADIVQDQSYTFENSLPYFQKSVNFTPPNYEKRGPDSKIEFDPAAFIPGGGPLKVSYANYYSPTSSFVKKAFEGVGLREIAGPNSGALIGFAEYPYTLDPSSATRSSSEASFLQEAIASTTLQVYQSTLANKIIFDQSKKASGVVVTSFGTSYTLSARKEVIIAAGPLRSPQLLMVSGIGPKETLQGLNIPVISPLVGVGQNLIDQPFFGPNYRVNVTGTQAQLSVNSSFLSEAIESYLSNQSGPLTTSVSNYLGWEKIPPKFRQNFSNNTIADLAKFPADWPEIQIDPIPSAGVPVNDTDNYMAFYLTLLTTTSRGNVTINTTNTQDNPIVNLNWLATETDQQLAVAAFKRAREIAQATGVIIEPEYAPGPAAQTDDQVLEYIRETVNLIFHAVSTCAMGPPNDPNAVVDTRGRVFGVKGLRIVDSSIFPILPPGQTQATVYMLGEKLADAILEDGGFSAS